MNKKIRNYIIFVATIIMVASWIVLLNIITPTEIIVKLGATNSYIILFLMSAIGGASLVTASSYYIVVYVLATGGLNIAYLGIVGGIGVTIGDSLYYYLGSRGKKVVDDKVDKRLEWLKKSVGKPPNWLMPILIYTYSGLIPLPNDIITFFLGITGYPYKKVVLPLLLGNITATLIIAYLAIYGMSLF
jgi:membrane protein DedA with SNARE-associated domain